MFFVKIPGIRYILKKKNVHVSINEDAVRDFNNHCPNDAILKLKLSIGINPFYFPSLKNLAESYCVPGNASNIEIEKLIKLLKKRINEEIKSGTAYDEMFDKIVDEVFENVGTKK